MELIKNENGTFTLVREVGSVDLTMNEVSFICNQMNKYGVRYAIEYVAREMDGDSIDLSKYPYTFDDFVGEIFDGFEDEIDCGNLPDDDDIKESIQDTARCYDMELD